MWKNCTVIIQYRANGANGGNKHSMQCTVTAILWVSYCYIILYFFHMFSIYFYFNYNYKHAIYTVYYTMSVILWLINDTLHTDTDYLCI